MIDRVVIHIKSGKGGNGAISGRHEKYVPRGGPDGGTGGNGGSVYLVCNSNVNTLLAYRYRRLFSGGNGGNGEGGLRHGKKGDDVELPVPVGTQVWSMDQQPKLMADLDQDGERVLIAEGGRGGAGNARYASPTNRFPVLAQAGEPGQELELRLELKLLADVGIIGAPNAGKSSLLAGLTAATPKVADYPFTTLEAALGVVEHHGKDVVLVDIPGLIEGAHSGIGLGHDFLRHIERTRILVHVIDGSLIDPAEQLREINNELELFDSSLSEKPQIVALNKIDMPEVRDLVEDIAAALAKESEAEVLCISAAGREGLDALMDEVLRKLETTPSFNERAANRSAESELPVLRPRPRSTKPLVRKDADGVYVVESADAIRVAAMVDVRKWEARIQFYRRLQHTGIDQALIDAGIMPGDSVRIGELEWEWE